MKSKEEIINIALETYEAELQAVSNLKAYINDEFAECVEVIYRCNGRVVLTGIGKSAIIAQKIVATLNSTGTPAIFMHAADAIHGDLGIVQSNDVVVCVSNSGNTPEIKVLLPMLKSLGAVLIGMVGNPDSELGRQANLVIQTTVEQEAAPDHPAPTSSTTAQLVMGDALAMALLHCRGFSIQDFARYHPGGSLGKQLYTKVEHLYPNNEKPMVGTNTPLREVIIEITSKRLGVTAVVENEQLCGIITDGDLRRMLQRNPDLAGLKASEIMTTNPKTVESKTLAVEALQLMRKHNITQLLVVENKQYKGVVHLHDILKEGII
ncbi:MAG TPA: KpsF/GutQ family sugar-phosphate isomerase [Bacteroidales bacterium]|nr:KpsF/GutQ family sugar-phosphate isomerase [Bacteroidales bacterium]